jgi:hypothetical protein
VGDAGGDLADGLEAALVLDAAHEPGALDGRGGLRGEGAEHARGLVEALGEVRVVDEHGHRAEHALGARHRGGELEAVLGVAQDHAFVGERVEPGGEEALLDGLEAGARLVAVAGRAGVGRVAELVGDAQGGGVLVGDGEAERGAAHGAAHLPGDLAVDAVEVERARQGEPGGDERLARAVARGDVDGRAGEAGDRAVVAARAGVAGRVARGVAAERGELHEEDALLVGRVARELPADDGGLAGGEQRHAALELLARGGVVADGVPHRAADGLVGEGGGAVVGGEAGPRAVDARDAAGGVDGPHGERERVEHGAGEGAVGRAARSGAAGGAPSGVAPGGALGAAVVTPRGSPWRPDMRRSYGADGARDTAAARGAGRRRVARNSRARPWTHGARSRRACARGSGRRGRAGRAAGVSHPPPRAAAHISGA